MTKGWTTISLLGLPGRGKTHTALALGEQLLTSGRPALVLHTDLLKVALRPFDPVLRGAGFSGTPARIRERARAILPHLMQQRDKALRDDYWLIVEGTLALELGPPHALRIVLTLDEATRGLRVKRKHASARATLERTSIDAYGRCLQALPAETTLFIESTAPPAAVARRILHRITRAGGISP